MGSHWDVLCKATAVFLFTVSQAIVAPGPQLQPLYYGKQCAVKGVQSNAFDGNNTTPNSLVWHIMSPHDSKVTLTQAHPIGNNNCSASSALASASLALPVSHVEQRPSTFRAPYSAHDHEETYERLGVPLWQVVRRGFLFEGKDLERLHSEVFVDPKRHKNDTYETHRVTMPVQDHSFFYGRLQHRFAEIFGEPLLVQEGMQMSMYSMRWSRALLEPNAPIGFTHEDGDDLEMCADLELPPEFAKPEASGWKWDAQGTAVAMLIGLRVPDSESGLGHSFVYSPDKARGEKARPQQRELKVIESVGEGEFVTFNPYRFHSQYVPVNDSDFSTRSSPKETRQQIVGFGLRQVPIFGGRHSKGRWVLQTMCKGTSNPAVKKPVGDDAH